MKEQTYPLNTWYVACTPDEIPTDKALARKVCGLELAFYRNEANQVAAVKDFCPHRGAPLSLGYVENGELVCGYHGLRMGEDGKTRSMPKQRVGGFPCINAYAVIERFGFIWLWPGEQHLADESLIPNYDFFDDPNWAYGGGLYHIKCDYRLMVDNLMDLTHETYVHSDSIGQVEIDEAPVSTHMEGEQVVTSRYMEDIYAPPFWQMALRANGLADDVLVDRWQICRFDLPSHIMLEVGVSHAGKGGYNAPEKDKANSIVVDFITPESDTSIWYFWGMARSFKPEDSELTDNIRQGQGKIFSEDLEVLEKQQHNLAQNPDRELLMLDIDAGGVQARSLIKREIAKENSKDDNNIPIKEHLTESSLQETAPVAPKEAKTAIINNANDTLTVRVKNKTNIDANTCTLILESITGEPLPSWQAGAHIDLHLANNLIRQYSLCSPLTASYYEIGVLKGSASRGGSSYIHNDLHVGDQLTISYPKNLFQLAKNSKNSLLLSAGIGITPLLAMAEKLSNERQNFRFIHTVKTPEQSAFLAQLKTSPLSPYSEIHYSQCDENDAKTAGRIDFNALFSSLDKDTDIYVCGPNSFIDEALATAELQGFSKAQLHKENFAAAEYDINDNAHFDIEIKSTGECYSVAPNQSILTVLTDNDVYVPVACEEGVCGSCVTGLLAGEAEHRDVFLTDNEKEAMTKIAVCCSRGKSTRLILDL